VRRLSEVRPILPPRLPALPRAPFVYKFWGTLIWSVLLVGVMAVGVVISGVVAILLYGFDFPASEEAQRAFLNNGKVTTGVTIGAIVAGLLVLGVAIRLAGQRPVDYLALRWPSAWHAAMGLGATFLLVVLLDVTSALIGWPRTPEVLINRLRNAREYHAVASDVLAVVVVAPIVEEIMFRGFIYRGFAASRLGDAAGPVVGDDARGLRFKCADDGDARAQQRDCDTGTAVVLLTDLRRSIRIAYRFHVFRRRCGVIREMRVA
jgi:membrane protease YdiL (CAAX protease family)